MLCLFLYRVLKKLKFCNLSHPSGSFFPRSRLPGALYSQNIGEIITLIRDSYVTLTSHELDQDSNVDNIPSALY